MEKLLQVLNPFWPPCRGMRTCPRKYLSDPGRQIERSWSWRASSTKVWRSLKLTRCSLGCNSIDIWNSRLELRRKLKGRVWGHIFWLWFKARVKALV